MLAELEKLRFFRDTPVDQLRILESKARIREYNAGDNILEIEPEEKFIGYIVEGVGTYSIADRDGVLHSVDTYSNAPVGMMFLDKFDIPGDLKAKTKVKVITWSMEDLDMFAQKHPRLALDFYKGMSFYLVQSLKRVISML